MFIYFDPQHPQLAKGVQEILRAFWGKINIVEDRKQANLAVSFNVLFKDEEIIVQAKVDWLSEHRSLMQQEISKGAKDAEAPNITRRLAKLALLAVLEKATGQDIGPWGILTGIRPTKIVHRLLDRGINQTDLIQFLREKYAVADEKARLLWEVTNRQRVFLHPSSQVNQSVGIYIGIPFCPTRCAYCSFPAYSLQQWGQLIPDFLDALLAEILATAQSLTKRGIIIEHIYVGGGTPTSLNEEQLAKLLRAIQQHLVGKYTKEFTVEAGRPDTITQDKLQVMRAQGVSRISINPQTMNEETLRLIGRSHSTQQVRQTMQQARELGFDNINMDLIIGLPGEDVAAIRRTLQEIKELQPENLTVHTLAIKRASQFNLGQAEYQQVSPEVVRQMLDQCYQFASQAEMEPYYLYRQKQMVGFLENVGFAKPGYESIYNIQVMEERQTIIGLGAGAGSKWLRPDFTLDNTYNPKDPGNYVDRIQEIIEKKQQRIEGLSVTAD